MSWFNNLTIRVKMFVGFSVVIALMIGLASFAIVEMRAVDHQNTYAIRFAGGRETAMLKFQSGARDLRRVVATMTMYAPLGEPERINPLINEASDAYNNCIEALDSYEKLLRDDTSISKTVQSERLEKAERLRVIMREYKSQVCDRVANHAKVGEHAQAIEAVRIGSGLISEMRDSTAELLEAASKMAFDADESASDTASRATWLIFIVSVVATIIAGIIAFYISGSISKPVALIAGYMKRASATGDLSLNQVEKKHIAILSERKDEIADLSQGANAFINVINQLIDDLGNMARMFNEDGDIEAKMDSTKYVGSYKEVTENINAMLGGLIKEVLMFINALAAFGNGNFNVDLPRLPGKKVVMNDTLDAFSNVMKSLNYDINNLVQNALNGELANRTDVSGYKGDWAKLVNGLNNLMDAVSAPTVEISKVMEQIAKGNFDSKLAGSYKGDYLVLQELINSTVTNIASYINEISNVLSELAQNNFDQEIKREYLGSFSNIKDATNRIINTFNSILGDISSSAGQVSSGARSISESSMTMATGASEQAASVEELNATILSINESTMHNSESAKNAELLSVHSKENAAIGDADMKNMLVSMEGIKESSNKISKIIKVIEDIAFQTNLLALNAAVEAARAGEHGKGFAVVAEEVRTLASRSQGAAKETSALIEESINRVGEGTQIADKTADALRTIVGDISKIADIISSIATSSHEQSEATSQVTQGLSQITDVVQNNSATSEEAASASQELSSQAELLHNLVSVFKLKR